MHAEDNMPIRLLSQEVASQIAAGEVVERPASVVKEAVENSIDAGAHDIRVEIRAGGKDFISVVDDGCGISSAEVEVAFQRHSTSKLNTADDLYHITTLGFRGEALASIAAVSRMTFITHTSAEPVGTLLRLEGGKIITHQDSGHPAGTALTVEDLFYNVPARRKFLRSDRTEQRHVDAWLTRYAMAYPDLRFTLSHNGTVVFQSPGNGRLRDVLIAVYGLEIGAAVIDIMPNQAPVTPPSAHPQSAIRVSGLISPPALNRANRTYITLFVNGRWVQDSRLTYAIIQAYHTLLPTGRYPLGVVMVSLPPDQVDVNVHPAKSEVRFVDADAVFRTVQRAVRSTLLQRSPIPTTSHPASSWGHPSGAATDYRGRFSELGRDMSSHQLALDQQNTPAPDLFSESTAPGEKLPPLRILGQINLTYLVAEGPDGMYLIDQHAAHERVLFEQLLSDRLRASVAAQILLEPVVADLPPESANILREHAETLHELGIQIEPFGGTSLLVRTMPAIVGGIDPVSALEDIASALAAGETPLAANIEDAVAREVCKAAAIKAGQVMAPEEMKQLIRALECTTSPRTCPHGRPTMIHISVSQLARDFGR
jgi:DNA mismatch repair protein MutL